METYKVKITPNAKKDLEGIYAYLALEKQEPQNARGQVDRIKAAILRLDVFPLAYPERMKGRYAGKKYRQLFIDNYIAIFRVDETKKMVIVLTVQYQRRNL